MSDRPATRADSTTNRLPTAEQVRAWAAEGTIPVPWIVGVLVMLFPVGLFFVWQRPQWATKTKWIWTGGWAAAFVVGMWLVAPLLIFLTLLGVFAVALTAIWSSPTLALDKKKLATGGAVGGLLLCLFAEFAFFSIRAYNAEKEEQRKKYAEQAVLDKEKARQKEEAVRQKLTEGNQLWASGDKVKAVALYRECIEMGMSRGGETSTVYQRVIEQDVSAGDLSAAKALIRQARRWGSVELAFTDSKCNELLKEVEVQIVEEKRVEEAKRQEDERRKADEAARKNDKSNPKGDKPSFRGGNKVAEAHAVDFLKKHLKAPATAEMQKVEMIDGKNAHYIVHITVDSENSFGARLRGSYLVFVIVTSDTTYNTLPTSIQEVSRTPTKEEIDAFKSINSWELLTK
jgi:hypothetical protein